MFDAEKQIISSKLRPFDSLRHSAPLAAFRFT